MAVPKIFQTFNSLLGGIVRKRNATIVGPSKQLVGEFPEVDFERLYQYYHHWDQIKTAVDVMHQKFRGSGISITSNNEAFNVFIKKWWDVSNAEKKWSQFIYSLLITGSAIMEIQFTPDGRIGNTEQIPMQTIYRIFRDQYGNELKLVQIVDGVFKELDPEFFIHATINNPDRQAFGKSMFHTLASPRPITGTVDPITGEAINPARNTLSLLDAQAELQNAEIEIKKKMAKPRLIVGAPGMPADQMEKIQAEMADPNTDQYIWIFDKPVQSAELQVAQAGKFNEYGDNVDAHIDVGTVFASNVIKNPGSFSYSGSQTPLDVLDQRMLDLQGDLIEILKDKLLKPLAESWGFKDFDMMDVEITFTPIVKRLTMEDIRGLDPLTVSKKERRELYKKQHIELDDNLWEEEQNEQKEQQAQQGMMNAQAMGMSMPPQGEGEDGDDTNPLMPKSPPSAGDSPAPSQTGGVKGPTVGEPKVPVDPNQKGAPTPKEKRPQPYTKKKGENLHTRLIKEIANEGLSASATIEAIKAVERIPLPPSATSTSSDLYVGQGIDDSGHPEITDPDVIKAFGLDEDSLKQDTAPSDPDKMAHAGDQQTLTGADNTQGRFTNTDNIGIPQVDMENPELEVKSEQEYLEHANNPADFTSGGTGDDRIDDESDGAFKDPYDLQDEMNPNEDETSIRDQHTGPNTGSLVRGDLQMSGGTDALPDNTKSQILGGNDNDEQPIVPDEQFPEDRKLKNDITYDRDEDEEEEIGEAIKGPDEVQQKFPTDTKDKIEGEDPFTSGTGPDQTPELNQIRKPQARLDDAPLTEEPNDFNATSEETPYDMRNHEQGDGEFSDVTDTKHQDVVGDSSQVRLQLEQEGEDQNPDRLQTNDGIMDNTGLNMEPENNMEYQNEDDLKKTQDGSNVLEQEGEPLEDGAIIMPDDVQQVTPTGTGIDPVTGEPIQDQTIIDDGAHGNDPTHSGIDEEEVDPNILHPDPIEPESGILFTDNTDEQGNEIPDLRFDQTPDSDEQQPEIENEYEIVTKEEYDQHVDGAFGDQEQFDAELDDPSMDMLETTPEEFKPEEDIMDPVETDEEGNEMPLTDVDGNPLEEEESSGEDSSAPKESSGGEEETSEEPKESSSAPKESSDKEEKDPNDFSDEPEEETVAEPKEEKPKSKSKPKEKKEEDNSEEDDDKEPDYFGLNKKDSSKDTPKEKSTPEKKKDPDKNDKEDSKSQSSKEPSEDEEDDSNINDSVDDLPETSGSVDEIIKREHELMEDGELEEEEIHDILLDEFKEEIVEDIEDDKNE
jgi:hypothetical protein